MAFQLALGCRTVGYTQQHRNCCNRCTNCVDLYARYGYTNLAISGLSGPIDLNSDGGPETWEGFTNSSISIPDSQGGFCDDAIINETAMSAFRQWYFGSSDPVKLYAGGLLSSFPGPRAQASVSYGCTLNVPARLIGVQVAYFVFGNVAAQFDEADFPDWTWTTIFTGGDGRLATKTFPDGSVVEWRDAWAGAGGSGGGPRLLSVNRYHIDFDLTDGVPPVTTLTLPTVPYDYLGVLTGTVTIS